jgi:putative transposase
MNADHGLSIRRGCKVMGLRPSVYYYVAKESEDGLVLAQLQAYREENDRWGFDKLYDLLCVDGFTWSRNYVFRVYQENGLQLKTRRKKRLPSRKPVPIVRPIMPNVTWSMDFMHDRLEYGQTFRSFNVIDDFNREALSITIDTSIGSERVIRELEQVVAWRGKPRRLRVDNGPEFIAHTMKQWCEKQGIELKFIQPGKPTQNSLAERFNRTYREEVLSSHLFFSLNQARQLTQRWMYQYNTRRPHQGLERLSPRAFMERYAKHNEQRPMSLPDFDIKDNPIIKLAA